MGLLKMRFTRLDKYFWSHSRRSGSISKVIQFCWIGAGPAKTNYSGFQSKRIAEGVERIIRRSNSRMGSESISEENESNVKKEA